MPVRRDSEGGEMNRFRLAVVTAALAAPLGALAPLGAAASAQAADPPPAAGAGAPTIPIVPASSAMSGGGPASGGPGTANCSNQASTSNFHENRASEALLPLEQLPANAVSVPTWSGSFTTGGTTYPFTMVGTDPAAGQATHVPVEIIPLRIDFAGNGCVLENRGMAADLEASPLFAPTDLGSVRRSGSTCTNGPISGRRSAPRVPDITCCSTRATSP